jgi:hypothetical protein
MTPQWRTAIAAAAERTRGLFRAGAPVADGVSGRLRLELRATWLGGSRILDKLEAVDFDVFSSRPTLGVTDVPALLWRTVTWSQARAARHTAGPRADPGTGV